MERHGHPVAERDGSSLVEEQNVDVSSRFDRAPDTAAVLGYAALRSVGILTLCAAAIAGWALYRR